VVAVPFRTSGRRAILPAGSYYLVYQTTDPAGATTTTTAADPLTVRPLAAAFSAAVAALTLPDPLVAGSAVRGRAVVAVTNTGNATFAGRVTLAPLLDGVAFGPPLARRVSVAAGRTVRLTIPLRRVPAVAASASAAFTVSVSATGNLPVDAVTAPWVGGIRVVSGR
jgi:hypothetical protein